MTKTFNTTVKRVLISLAALAAMSVPSVAQTGADGADAPFNSGQDGAPGESVVAPSTIDITTPGDSVHNSIGGNGGDDDYVHEETSEAADGGHVDTVDGNPTQVTIDSQSANDSHTIIHEGGDGGYGVNPGNGGNAVGMDIHATGEAEMITAITKGGEGAVKGQSGDINFVSDDQAQFAGVQLEAANVTAELDGSNGNVAITVDNNATIAISGTLETLSVMNGGEALIRLLTGADVTGQILGSGVKTTLDVAMDVPEDQYTAARESIRNGQASGYIQIGDQIIYFSGINALIDNLTSIPRQPNPNPGTNPDPETPVRIVIDNAGSDNQAAASSDKIACDRGNFKVEQVNGQSILTKKSVVVGALVGNDFEAASGWSSKPIKGENGFRLYNPAGKWVANCRIN